jgi:hypothetical protein
MGPEALRSKMSKLWWWIPQLPIQHLCEHCCNKLST